ncbi:hypothetical protein [Streptomyces sp. NPDC059080]|uniref:hypothetical protein n=1 Tax=Streptomyces sp. NPDC059080 TaxID=3346718 RepID=UPI0036957225
MTAEPAPARTEARPSLWRLWAAASGIAGAVVLTIVAIGSTSAVLFRGSALFTAVLLFAAYQVAKPWAAARSERWHRGITAMRMTVYVFVHGMALAVAFSLLPGDRAGAGSILAMIWAIHIAGWVREPTSFAYERLRGRFTWAAALRIAAMFYGTVGAIFMVRSLPVPERYAPAVFATCISVVIGLVVTSLKVLTRVRKLATELDSRAQKVERCLERLSRCPVAERSQRRDAAEDAWDDLNRTLRNKVETGFHLYGTFVIPTETRKNLESLVEQAIASPGAPPHRETVIQLGKLRSACSAKIDTVA